MQIRFPRKCIPDASSSGHPRILCAPLLHSLTRPQPSSRTNRPLEMRRAVRAGTRRGVPAALPFIIGTGKPSPYTPCFTPGVTNASVMHGQNRHVARAAGLRQHQLQIAVRRIRRQLDVYLVQTHQCRCQAGEIRSEYSFHSASASGNP